MPNENEFIMTLFLDEWQAGINREENFQRLFKRYYHPVYHFFAKRGFSADECEELTQETFFCIYKGIEAFRREAKFETWLFQIATNVYRQVWRRQSLQKHQGDRVSLETVTQREEAALLDQEWTGLWFPSEPLNGLLEQEQRQMLCGAIEELPEQMRRCVILRVYRELSYQQIASAMSLSVETVKTHLHVAQQQLKRKLAHSLEATGSQTTEKI
jgi:RNA polymerase sigma-70 factor (ECF subfamily)